MTDSRQGSAHNPAAAIDPVCGMTIDPAKTTHHAEHGGRTFHFCSDRCRTRFLAEPDRFLAKAADAVPAAADSAAIYTCPMHPQVRQHGPGACPICGMALEPERVLADAPSNPELADMKRRLWIGGVLAAPVFALEMGGHLFDLHAVIGPAASDWIQFALSAPVVLWVGAPFFRRAWTSLTRRALNMFTLIAMGVGAAFAYSALAMLAPDLFPEPMRTAHGMVPVYFEAAAVIVVLVVLGQVLELRARERTSGALKALLNLAPKIARRVRLDGADEDVPVEMIVVGDILRLRPGEKIPVDGMVTQGQAAIDESLISGESLPVAKAAGDGVTAGSLNRTGSFLMRADKVGADTLLAQIVEMVAKAQRSRAPIQGLADRVSAWFVPGVLACAVLAFAIWMTVGPQPRLAYALLAAVSVLIIACPCALGLATPISIMVGVGRGAQSGVLIRDAEALERFEAIDTLVVDKTGTLTIGRPMVQAIQVLPGVEENTLLRLAAGLERSSEHPLGDAIVRAAADRGLILAEAEAFDSPPGKGVTGRIEGRSVVVGGAAFLAETGVSAEPLAAHAEALRADGAGVVFVAVDGALAGLIAVADPIKASAAEAVRGLQAAGVRIVMMTGDTLTTAQAVARRLGVTEVQAEVLPQDKAAVVARLKAEGRAVAMAGDGVNDAPALAAADVGVAMGGGADVAIESAGVVLLGGDLLGVLRARRLSAAVMRNIRQNLAFAFVYNTAGVPVAAGLLYPSLGILLSPQIAALAMALSSVSVISNALRLRSAKL
jgi:Cu+-exporting ATPase